MADLPPWSTKLQDAEQRIGAFVGAARYDYARSTGRDPGLGPSRDRVGPDKDIRGCLAEMAAALILNVSWRPNVGRLDAPDIGRRIQVRSTDLVGTGRLIVKPAAADEDPYCLIEFRLGVFTLVGWAFAADAKKWPLERYGKDPAHYMPRKALLPNAELVEWIRWKDTGHVEVQSDPDEVLE